MKKVAKKKKAVKAETPKEKIKKPAFIKIKIDLKENAERTGFQGDCEFEIDGGMNTYMAALSSLDEMKIKIKQSVIAKILGREKR